MGVTWTGIEEYIDELTNAPETLARDSDPIVGDTAEDAANEIRQAYPVRTGHLRNSVRIRRKSNQTKAAAQVVNVSEYATPFEYGTQARHTSIGANRGSMPAGKVFIPIVLRRRRRMERQIGDQVLTPQGAIVTYG
jgi:hypothetical protein